MLKLEMLLKFDVGQNSSVTVTPRERLLEKPRWSDHVRAERYRRDCFVGHNGRMASSPQERADTSPEPLAWIKSQLCQLVKEAPSGQNWAHEL